MKMEKEKGRCAWFFKNSINSIGRFFFSENLFTDSIGQEFYF